MDGSQGEGGGQVLRSALTLAGMTGQAMRISRIRAGRPKPGLAAQHLTAVKAIAEVCSAQVEGATPGSTSLTFIPGSPRPGTYRFDIGTAGATTLVLQTIFLPLSVAQEASTVAITGGTHVPWSPCFHYLDWHWLPVMRQAGFDARLKLKRAGFYPRGGGRIQALIRPAPRIKPLQLVERGALERIRGLSTVANLPGHIAERQRKQALRRLKSLAPADIQLASLQAPSPGTFLLLLAEFEHTRACFFALGKKGKPAERVADEAVEALEAFLTTRAATDPYLADQLLLPLAFAGGESQVHTARISHHLRTNAAVIEAFMPGTIAIQGQPDGPGIVHITPGGGAGTQERGS